MSLIDAAVRALANYKRPDVRTRLIELAADAQQREPVRLAAIRALGTMTEKRAAKTLIDLLTADTETASVQNEAAGNRQWGWGRKRAQTAP